MRASIVTLTAAAAGVVLLATACSSSSTTSASQSSGSPASAAASAGSAAAQPACDPATFGPVVADAIGKDSSVRDLRGADCVDGWAVLAPTIGPADGSTDGEIDITLVFKAENGTWVVQDRSAVCGTLPTGDGSPSYPSDSQVPEKLWLEGCQTN